MFEPTIYQHPNLEEAYLAMQETLIAEDSILEYYRRVVIPQRKMDLLGKTVKVTERQFPALNNILHRATKRMQIKLPDLYVYEDFYYGADVAGYAEDCWIEISAKTVTDFEERELLFLLGRQLAKIHSGLLYGRILVEQTLNLFNTNLGSILGSLSLGLSGAAVESFQLMANRWLRLANYTADAGGYLVCGELSPSINAIIKEVLNSKHLSNAINISSFIEQTNAIDLSNDVFSSLAKAKQDIPFAPYRIKELMRFASSEHSKKTLLKGDTGPNETV